MRTFQIQLLAIVALCIGAGLLLEVHVTDWRSLLGVLASIYVGMLIRAALVPGKPPNDA